MNISFLKLLEKEKFVFQQFQDFLFQGYLAEKI